MKPPPRADGRDNGDNTPILGPEHLEAVVERRMMGLSHQAIADQMGLSRASVQRFCNQPEFKAALNAAHRDVLETANRRLASASAPALNVLLRAMNFDDASVPWTVRMRASEVLFRMLGIERMAESFDTASAATVEAARTTLAGKLADMAPKVQEANRLRIVEATADDGEDTGS